MSNGRNEGPPDLDELWRDFNRKLSRLFGGRGGNDGGGPSGNGGGNLQPDMKGAGIGVGLVVGVVALGWLASGVFIVQEGQQGVITSFGKYSRTVDAGIQYRLPYPFQAHEVVSFTQLQTVDVGRNSVGQASGLRDSSMLTQDENIIDIRFTVQYRLKDSRDYLFENVNTDEAVNQASESAVREIVGRSNMDSVLYEQRDAIATDLAKSIQAQLDRLKTGIQIVNVNVSSVQPPEQVQAAFDDAFRATADRERLKNEGEAYANDVIPRAQGQAARLREDAEAYRAKVVSFADGDAQRFKSVLAEYQKAPAVTRDRLYIDTMQQVYSRVTKVMVDARAGSNNLLYLPLDKLLQQQASTGTVTTTVPTPALPTDPAQSGTSSMSTDPRSRDSMRGRDREGR
ncbi:FtsH protease activity modulator HflK [Mitsuaria sp. GD03876]|uniref:FtsH protease activity modulator HflK n=1 Tax=Mitsuaria sp. GD03876 TaxID=2975399 RepID=UPI0024491EDC|nr:FtsH protease activity modulator HflK [Mitsuaria sp. GD03876]MDH0868307.1 FtsH protease activity modulator HflK [Mitsuaria sp. GD03876]